MVDTADSKSAAREGVRVQVSSPVKPLWLQNVCSEAIFFALAARKAGLFIARAHTAGRVE